MVARTTKEAYRPFNIGTLEPNHVSSISDETGTANQVYFSHGLLDQGLLVLQSPPPRPHDLIFTGAARLKLLFSPPQPLLLSSANMVMMWCGSS